MSDLIFNPIMSKLGPRVRPCVCVSGKECEGIFSNVTAKYRWLSERSAWILSQHEVVWIYTLSFICMQRFKLLKCCFSSFTRGNYLQGINSVPQFSFLVWRTIELCPSFLLYILCPESDLFALIQDVFNHLHIVQSWNFHRDIKHNRWSFLLTKFDSRQMQSQTWLTQQNLLPNDHGALTVALW